jgi:uncharacterized paraquat-inducible protein A
MFIKSPESENKNLMACKDCGQMVSRKATTCPHCGTRIKISEVNQLARILIFLIVLGILGAILLPILSEMFSRLGELTGAH